MHRLKKTVLIQTYSMEPRYKKLSICREYQSLQPVKTFKHLTQIKHIETAPVRENWQTGFTHSIQVNFNTCFHSRWICNEKVTFFEEAKF